MKCPHCGYDKIQPNFNFCPKCKRPLKEQSITPQPIDHEHADVDPREKGFINRAIARWTYERAMADPYAYASWAYRNPNDNRVYLERWKRDGNDLTVIRQAIAEANRARHENPTTDRTEVDANIIDSTRRSSRRESDSTFVQAVNSDYTTDAAALVRNKAIWKLQPGELARHIAPDEWGYVSEHLEGLVIEEGTSAIIFVDGQEVAQMGSGMYVFDDKHKAAADIEAERRKHENQGFFSRLADGIYRFFTGHKREESTQQREERRRRVQQIIGRLKKDTIIDVYLKSDRIFPAIFEPYIVQSRYMDLQVGVSTQMQIGNFKDFIANYLAGRKTVTVTDVVKSVETAVFSILRFQFREIEVSERGLDEVTFNAIRERLKTNLPNLLHGLVVIDVLDIATTNEQLKRFRQVEEQLYCSEQEYDFLLRTNEFRNRIASEENDQKIREARSEQDLRVRLDEINKDNLLHADEMEQFVSLLMNQKVIREATNKADLDKALLEIQRNNLISKEEFEIFLSDLENRRFDRDQVSEQLRVRSLLATALQKMEADKTLTLQKIEDKKTTNIAVIHAKDEISDAEWETYRKERARDAEDWDLEAAIYGRKYVLDRQKLIDEAEKRRLENAKAAEEIVGKKQEGQFTREEKLADHEVDEKIKEDEYRRKVQEKEDKLKELQRLIDLDQDTKDRETRRDLEEKRALAELELTRLKEEHEQEIKRRTIEADLAKTKIQVEGNMSAEQWVARNVAQMDAGAQAKFAESFSHLTETELAKKNAEEREKLYQQMIDMAKANNVDMREVQSANAGQQMEIIKMLLATFGQMSGAQNAGQQNLVGSLVGAMQSFATTRFNDAKDIKEEYREQMQHEQGRTDATQSQALDSATRIRVSENTPGVVRGTSVNVNVNTRTCPTCGQPIDDDDISCCPICGTDLK